jgi:hypothetical protein
MRCLLTRTQVCEGARAVIVHQEADAAALVLEGTDRGEASMKYIT